MISHLKTHIIDNSVYTPTITEEIIEARHLPVCSSENKMSSILQRLGYLNRQQQLNYIKLLGISGGLSETRSVQCPQDRLLTNEEAFSILNELNFDSDQEAFEWLVRTTQDKWIRKTHVQEGAGGMAEAKLARWFVQDSSLMTEYQEELQSIIDNLGFFSGTTWQWQESTHPSEVLLMGGPEEQIVERLESLEQLSSLYPVTDYEIPLNYLTGNRGVFNFEPSLAPMLAQEWFKDAKLETSIQQVLNDNRKDWKDGRVRQLQLLILAAIEKRDAFGDVVLTKTKASELVTALDAGEDNLEAQELINIHWPQEGFYYESPEKYNAQPTAGWPVAADIVAYHLNQMKKQAPGVYDHFKIVPIIANGKGGRLANTGDTVEQWMLERGSNLLSNATVQPILLASLSSQPHTMYMHETAVQLLPPNFRLVTVSITPKKPVLVTTTLDVAARLLYTVKGEFIKSAK